MWQKFSNLFVLQKEIEPDALQFIELADSLAIIDLPTLLSRY